MKKMLIPLMTIGTHSKGDKYIPGEIIAFGYPKNEIRTTTKKDIEEIIFYNEYN